MLSNKKKLHLTIEFPTHIILLANSFGIIGRLMEWNQLVLVLVTYNNILKYNPRSSSEHQQHHRIF